MTPTKRAWIILVVILAVELVPFTFTLERSRAGVAARLYGFVDAPWSAWITAMVIATGYVGYATRTFPPIRENFFTLSSMKAVAIAFAIVTGTVEELYFRKFLMGWAAQQGISATGQIAVSAVIFGAAHGVWGIFAKQWRMALGAVIATGILGGLLAVVYLIAGRQIAPCIWAHMLINLAIEPWLILAAASACSDPQRLGIRV